MLNKYLLTLGGIVVVSNLSLSLVQAQDQFALDSETKKYSYAVGSKIAQQLQQQFGQPDSGIDIDAMLAGLVDGISGKESLMSVTDIDQVIQAKQREVFEATAKKALDTEENGKKYREQFKQKSGVAATESGIQYLVQSEGEGDNPAATDTVVVHYRGTLIDGSVFDSSYDRGEPATFPVNGVIQGWQEVLQLMKPGAKWTVVIPPELAYGERGAGNAIGPNETLTFEIELLEIK